MVEGVRVGPGIHRVQIAPMLDVSYQDFRYVVAHFWATLSRVFLRLLTARAQIWTEMVVDQVLTHNSDKAQVLMEHLEFSERENPIVLQLGGSDPVKLAQATRISYDYGYIDQINLNAGCPSCRVAGKGEFGAALIKNPPLIQECLRSMALAAPVSISLKTRLGVDDLDSYEFFDSFVDQILETPLPQGTDFSLVVHARKAWLSGLSPAQNRSVPPLNYERAFTVCGGKTKLKKWYLNGGINTLSHAKELLGQGPPNMEGVMMGRAAMNNPCEFARTDSFLYYEDTDPSSAATRRSLIEAYGEYLHDRYPNDVSLNPGKVFRAMKPVLGVFHGQKGNRQWRVSLDQLSRDATLRNELGPAGILEGALKSMDDEILDLKLGLSQ
jgi:tRNA-dihydrouridine synthase A